MRRLNPRLASFVLLVVGAGFAACASKDSEPPKTSASEPAAVAQPGQYQAQPGADGAAPPPATPDTGGAATPFEAFDQAERELESAFDGKNTVGAPLTSGDRCMTVCKALASMRRSADEICNLDASRCTDARARLTKAEERAKSSCPACSTPT